MRGKLLLKRILAVLVGLLGFLLFAAALRLEAVPIKPDLKKVLAQPPEGSAQFAPARAGWDGPETPRRADAAPNPTLEALSPVASARAARASLIAAAIPDYRAVAGIALVILLLRRIRKMQKARRVTPAQVATLPHQASPGQADIERAA